MMKLIDEKVKQEQEYVSHNVLERDDYAQRVGAIRGFEILREDITNLYNTIFPKA
jgi:hypothetical protein